MRNGVCAGNELAQEHVHMPLGSGRTIRERHRKAAVEQRMGELEGAISRTRTELRRLLGR